jgi:hypothetical protein
MSVISPVVRPRRVAEETARTDVLADYAASCPQRALLAGFARHLEIRA